MHINIQLVLLTFEFFGMRGQIFDDAGGRIPQFDSIIKKHYHHLRKGGFPLRIQRDLQEMSVSLAGNPSIMEYYMELVEGITELGNEIIDREKEKWDRIINLGIGFAEEAKIAKQRREVLLAFEEALGLADRDTLRLAGSTTFKFSTTKVDGKNDDGLKSLKLTLDPRNRAKLVEEKSQISKHDHDEQ